MDYYHLLLDAVPAERTSVPVLMHAMLEQLSRNLADPAEGFDSSLDEVASSCAAAQAEGALAEAFASFGLASSAIFAPVLEPPSDYTLIQEGDELGFAAAGLASGQVRDANGRRAGALSPPRSPLDAAHALSMGLPSAGEDRGRA